MKWRDFGITVIVGFVVIAMLSSNTQVSADNTTYYIDFTDGSDAANGTSPATAWKTISQVNGETFLPGDQILFQRGETWNNEELIIPSSGTSLNPIVIGAYGEGANPVLDGDDNSASGGNGISLETQSYVNIQDLEIHSFARGILLDASPNVNVQRVVIHDTHFSGISITAASDAVTIQNSLIHTVTTDGVVIDDSDNATINYSIIRNSGGDGVLVSGTSANATLQNSVLYANTSDGLALTESASGTQATNVIVANSGAFGINPNALDLTLATSITFNNTGGDFNGAYTDGGGNLAMDPLFANAPANDFRLTSGSPAINGGTDIGITTDFAGSITVPQGGAPDIGAYEFAVPSAATSLAQFKADGTTSLAAGAWTNESTVVIKFYLASANPNDLLTALLEFRPVGTDFTGTNTHASSQVAYAGSPVAGSITVTGLTNFSNYHWQLRLINSAGTSPFSAFGGNAETAADVRVDISAPTTTSSGTDANWHNANVTVTLACSDLGSGCANTYYTTNGTTPTTSSTSGLSLTLSTEGTHTVKYFSTDAALNAEGVKTAANVVKIDKTKPTGTVFINSGANTTTSRSVSIKLSAIDTGGSGNHQVLLSDKNTFAGAIWQDYTTTVSFSFTDSPAVKTIYVKFKDLAGNESDVYTDTITYLGVDGGAEELPGEETPAEEEVETPVDTNDPTNFALIAAVGAAVAALTTIVGVIGYWVTSKPRLPPVGT